LQVVNAAEEQVQLRTMSMPVTTTAAAAAAAAAATAAAAAAAAAVPAAAAKAAPPFTQAATCVHCLRRLQVLLTSQLRRLPRFENVLAFEQFGAVHVTVVLPAFAAEVLDVNGLEWPFGLWPVLRLELDHA